MNPWRSHPKLAGKFLPDHPDDLQVWVHDGGPRLTDRAPEAVWVTVTGMDGDVFQGRVLNVPHNLQTVRENDLIRFVPGGAHLHPVMVTEKYLQERPRWNIEPCDKCGLSELFDAPSDLIRVIFPQVPPGSEMAMFTSFCPLCGGIQGVELRPSSEAKRPWWRFWG